MSSLLDSAPRIGMGCWAIGGPFWSGDVPVGYAGADKSESIRAIHTAWSGGVRVYDTSAVYGAGQSEHLLGEALAQRPEAVIVSKLGHSFDENTRQMTGSRFDRAYVKASVEDSLRRLRRDQIDTILLHLNDLPVDQAEAVFATLEELRVQGKVRAYGWSTDFWDQLDAVAGAPHFQSVEHAMNLFFDAPSICEVADKHDLTQLIRSPLGMGVLTGKFSTGAAVPRDDVRHNSSDWQGYFEGGKARGRFVDQLASVRELLMPGGRTLTQGALCWLLAKSSRALPVPGAKTAAQAEENAGALVHGPLTPATMSEIESILSRPLEGPPRAR